MSVTINNSPMHITCTVGQPFGEPNPSYSLGYHTGIDFPASGTAEANPDLYACCSGIVTYVYKDSTGTTPALGNQVQIKDDVSGNYFRYCHLLYGSVTVNVGDRVTTLTKIGKMGNTGNSTGTHLHLEATPTSAWSDFLNPR